MTVGCPPPPPFQTVALEGLYPLCLLAWVSAGFAGLTVTPSVSSPPYLMSPCGPWEHPNKSCVPALTWLPSWPWLSTAGWAFAFQNKVTHSCSPWAQGVLVAGQGRGEE